MTFTTSIDPQGRIYVREDGEKSLVVGTVDQPHAQMWADWYADWKNSGWSEDRAKWPILGLQSFATDENVLFIFDGLHAGTIGWTGGAWWWYLLDSEAERCGTEHIDVDPEQSKQFRDERNSIAMADPRIRDVLLAEFEGRLRIFRDDTRPMAMMFGKSKARRVGVYRRSRSL